jgi:hypothetical protein
VVPPPPKIELKNPPPTAAMGRGIGLPLLMAPIIRLVISEFESFFATAGVTSGSIVAGGVPTFIDSVTIFAIWGVLRPLVIF